MSRRAWVEQLMGIPMSIHVRGAHVDDVSTVRAVRGAFDELARMDALFSTYRPGSQLSRYRRGELSVEQADPLLEESLRLVEEAERVTAGAFTGWLPGPDRVRRFDPTGLVKGWAVDRAARALAGLPASSWCVNAGGDILAGRHPHVPPTGEDSGPWRVGVEDPLDRRRLVAVVPLTVGALATSGTAARGAHLYDPSTAAMVARPGSRTVVAPTLVWADIWATALFVGGAPAADAFVIHAVGCQTFAA